MLRASLMHRNTMNPLAVAPKPDEVLQHRPYEDIQALLTGTAFVALGIQMFNQLGLLTGGTAGLAIWLHYATGWNFGAIFFAINLPFYALAYRRMGRAFTFKTFAAVALLSALTNLLPQWLHLGELHPLAGALLGGVLMGTGMLILFRHQASLGGFNVLVLYLQATRGWRAGRMQMALDCTIVLLAFAVTDWRHVAWSVLGAVALNQTLATNHRAGRYMAH